MIVVTDPSELVDELAVARRAGRRIGLVPTLGALHAGHGTLIERAVSENATVCVSVFVNPLQFNDPADFGRYPRDIAGDAAFAAAAGATHVFAPEQAAMLGDRPGAVTVDPGPMAEILEGASRPGHFRGVATIVTKLFALAWPDAAYFGEKDFQQLAIVRSLAGGLSFPLEVVACPTVREADGLALSSRNARLSDRARLHAPTLYAALRTGARVLEAGGSADEAEASMAGVVATVPEFSLDYAVVRDGVTLDPVGCTDGRLRLLIAASIDGVRLIDNIDPSSTGDVDEVEYPAGVQPAPFPAHP